MRLNERSFRSDSIGELSARFRPGKIETNQYSFIYSFIYLQINGAARKTYVVFLTSHTILIVSLFHAIFASVIRFSFFPNSIQIPVGLSFLCRRGIELNFPI